MITCLPSDYIPPQWLHSSPVITCLPSLCIELWIYWLLYFIFTSLQMINYIGNRWPSDGDMDACFYCPREGKMTDWSDNLAYMLYSIMMLCIGRWIFFLLTSKECDFFLTQGSHLPTKSVVFYKHEVWSTNLRPVLWTICVYDSSPTNSAQWF